MKKKQWGVN